MFKYLTFFLLAILAVANAIVINPKITLPNSSTKWRAGNTYVVQWDTSFFDGEQTVPIPDVYTGMLKLGYFEGDDQYNEHLYWDLASGFKLNAGALTITLPSNLDTKTSYIVVLMGNSGNASARFTIQAAK